MCTKTSIFLSSKYHPNLPHTHTKVYTTKYIQIEEENPEVMARGAHYVGSSAPGRTTQTLPTPPRPASQHASPGVDHDRRKEDVRQADVARGSSFSPHTTQHPHANLASSLITTLSA